MGVPTALQYVIHLYDVPYIKFLNNWTAPRARKARKVIIFLIFSIPAE